jgi:hypothetical protein
VPAYGAGGWGARLLQQCLDSIVKQEVWPDQVVISAERDFFNSAAMVVGSLPKAFPVEVVCNAGPSGIGANSNSALSRIETEYAWMLHQDDSLFDQLTTARTAAELAAWKHPWYVLATTNINPFTGAITSAAVGRPVWKGRSFLLSGRNSLGPPSNCVWRTSPSLIYDEDLELLVDVDFYLRILDCWRAAPRAVGATVAIGNWPGQTQRRSSRRTLVNELPALWRNQMYRLVHKPVLPV